MLTKQQYNVLYKNEERSGQVCTWLYFIFNKTSVLLYSLFFRYFFVWQSIRKYQVFYEDWKIQSKGVFSAELILNRPYYNIILFYLLKNLEKIFNDDSLVMRILLFIEDNWQYNCIDIIIIISRRDFIF